MFWDGTHPDLNNIITMISSSVICSRYITVNTGSGELTREFKCLLNYCRGKQFLRFTKFQCSALAGVAEVD